MWAVAPAPGFILAKGCFFKVRLRRPQSASQPIEDLAHIRLRSVDYSFTERHQDRRHQQPTSGGTIAHDGALYRATPKWSADFNAAVVLTGPATIDAQRPVFNYRASAELTTRIRKRPSPRRDWT